MKILFDGVTGNLIEPKNMIRCHKDYRCPRCQELLFDGLWVLRIKKYRMEIARHCCKKCCILFHSGHTHHSRLSIWKSSIHIIQKNEKIADNSRFRLISLLGNKCKNCGITDMRVLLLDHKFNDGRYDRNQFGESGWFNKYLSDPLLADQRIQVLCQNCHFLKHRKPDKYSLDYAYFKKINKKIVFFMDQK